MSTTTLRTVAVIVPTYRAGPFLVKLCASLAAQTHADFKAYILSDGCDDHQQPGLEPYRTDPRFQIGAWSPNRGVAAATAHLWSQVQEPYWCYPGADDLLHPEFLARRLAVMEQHPAANVIFGQGVQINEEDQEVWWDQARQTSARLGVLGGRVIEPHRMLEILVQDNIINTPSIFCRSSATLPLLQSEPIVWRFAQDYHYWIVLAAGAGGFYYDPAVLHSYRLHSASLSREATVTAARFAEIRLVVLVALAHAARVSPLGTECWKKWRKDLYALWLMRAISLLRRGQLDWAWQQQASRAYHGVSHGGTGLFLDLIGLGGRIFCLRLGENRRATRQIWVGGLRRIDDPIFFKTPGRSAGPAG